MSDVLGSKRFSAHSLRSGGSTALYVRWISLEHIRRFGRLASDTSRRYLYSDNQVFRFIGIPMAKETGILGQLQMTQPPGEQVAVDQSEGDSGVERCRVGGKGGKETIYDQVQIRWMSEYRTVIGKWISRRARQRAPVGEMCMVILCLMAICK